MMSKLSVPGPEDIVRQEFPNGIIALARPNFTSPSVVIQGLIQAGSVDEPAEKAGLAAFTAEMLERGTTNRTFAQINEEVEAVGASLWVDGGLHMTGFGAKCLVEDLPLILDILADVLQNPAFPAAEVEKVRGEIMTGLQQRDNNTRAMANLAFRELVYPDHPYGRSGDGYRHTIPEITWDDLISFYQQYYRPQRMMVVLVGAVEPGEGLEMLHKAFRDWQPETPRPPQELPPTRRLTSVQQKTVTLAGKSQSDLVLGCPGLARKDPDYLAANLANLVLGGFGMMGRLGDNVRDELGLAYYVFSRLEAGLGPGPWAAIAGVNPKNVERAVAAILDEIRRLRDTLVSDEELEDSKAYLIGSLPLRLETNEGVARAILDMELYDLRLDYLQRYEGLVRAITAEDVQRVAQKYLHPEAYALAIAGP